MSVGMKNAVETALQRRASEITRRIDALVDEKIQLAVELSRIRKARKLLRGASPAAVRPTPRHPVRLRPLSEAILDALAYQDGATASDLLAMFRVGHGRAVLEATLASRLTRLRNTGVVMLESGVWKLADGAALRSRKDADETHFLIINPAIGDRL